MVEAVINTCSKSVLQLHNVMHGFFSGRGAGTAIVELKLGQELASVDQDPLLLVLLDLGMVYNNLYRGILLQNIEGYGVGLKLRRLIVGFWSIQEVVT